MVFYFNISNIVIDKNALLMKTHTLKMVALQSSNQGING
jgi:hypothetical protein